MNLEAVKSIYFFEMARTRRTLLQSVVSPVISTSLYFIVFGAAVGSRIQEIDGVSYGAFITPGLIMLTLLTQCIGNGSFGIYFPKFTGTIYELLSSPVSMTEIVLGYVGAAATKGMMIGLIILGTASLFVDLSIAHPFVMLLFFVLTAVTFSLFGFIIGIWAKDFEQLNLIPMLVIPPLVFLGRQLLFGQHAAAVLAGGQPFQSGALSHQRLPLELLRDRRRQPGGQLCDHHCVSGGADGAADVDLQDGIPAAKLSTE